jgi:hypothetical protein
MKALFLLFLNLPLSMIVLLCYSNLDILYLSLFLINSSKHIIHHIQYLVSLLRIFTPNKRRSNADYSRGVQENINIFEPMNQKKRQFTFFLNDIALKK